MVAQLRNLLRISLSEYQLKLVKNSYPLTRAEQPEVSLSLLDHTDFRRHNLPAPIALSRDQKLVLLDYFNTEGRYCHFCHVPYSFGARDLGEGEVQLCTICYLITFPKPTSIYVVEDDETSLSVLGSTVKISTFEEIRPLFSKEELEQWLSQQKPPESRDSSLDDFF